LTSSNQTNGGGGGGDLVSVSNPYAGWKYDVGPSGYDRLNNLSFNFIYDLPFHAARVQRVRENGCRWLAGFRHRQQLNLVCRSTLRWVATQAVMVSAETTAPTKWVLSQRRTTKAQWITDSAFAVPAPGVWGSLPYDAVRGPGRDNWNLSLFKNFVINEARGSQFELRLETFNTFNHPQISACPLAVPMIQHQLPRMIVRGPPTSDSQRILPRPHCAAWRKDHLLTPLHRGLVFRPAHNFRERGVCFCNRVAIS